MLVALEGKKKVFLRVPDILFALEGVFWGFINFYLDWKGFLRVSEIFVLTGDCFLGSREF